MKKFGAFRDGAFDERCFFQPGGGGAPRAPRVPFSLGVGAQRQEEASIVFLSPKLVCDALDRASPDA